MKNILKKKKTSSNSVSSAQKPKSTFSRKKIINAICISFLCICLVGSISVYTYVSHILETEGLESGVDGLTNTQSTVLYDNEGEIITTLSLDSGVRENVDYIDIPQVVIDAFLAAEDSRFFEHSGFDLPRVISSGLANVQASGIVQGGSTLTMQLVDVAYFQDSTDGTESTLDQIEQKIVEVFKAMEIESLQTKEEIIENYLNKVNFGGSARGIQKGAQYYFGKDVSEITLSEAAYLAGVVNAPATYNAYTGYYEYAVSRRNTIIGLMEYHGYITSEEADLAKSVDLSKQLAGVTLFETDSYQSFIDAVVLEVYEVTGESPYETPMYIYTTMDRDAQDLADSILNGEYVDYIDDLYQTGFAAINNQTGEILALGGGRGYSSDDDTRINRAYGDEHQVGSTSKPLASYAFGFEYLGYSTMTVVEDGPVDNYTSDGGTMYNANRDLFRGDITLMDALGYSLNLPSYNIFMDVISEIGQTKYMEVMHSMGLLEDLEYANGGISIGGSEFTTSPLELAAAYQVFANDGYYQETYTVTKIEFIDDDTKEDYNVSVEKVKVFSEETAYLISTLLQNCVENTSYYTLMNQMKSAYTVYAKSGTTDYGDTEEALYGIPSGSGKDKWMVGYTNTYTVACWAGWDMAVAGMGTYLTSATIEDPLTADITKLLLNELVGDDYNTAIEQPSGVVSISHILGLFPLSTFEDTDKYEDYLVTAYINKAFSDLAILTPDELEELSSFTANLSSNTLTLEFVEYPDIDKLTVASSTKEMDAGGVTTTGALLFDKSFIYGAVEYKWDIYVNDELIDSGSSSDTNNTTTISTNNGDSVKVCGYYGYQNADTVSNEICQTIISDAKTVYTVDSSFENLFSSSTTFETASSIVNLYAETYLDGVTIKIIENPDYTAGQYDISNSTLTPGASVSVGETYIVSIGSKTTTSDEDDSDE